MLHYDIIINFLLKGNNHIIVSNSIEELKSQDLHVGFHIR